MSKGTYSHSNRHRMHELKQKGDDFCCKNSTKKDEPQGTNHDEVANLKGIIKEQKRILSTCMYALQENEELMKDKERLDWLVDNASISMLRKDEDGEEWWVELDYSEARKDIDEYMNQSPSIFDDLSDSQRQQICHEHGQPTQ